MLHAALNMQPNQMSFCDEWFPASQPPSHPSLKSNPNITKLALILRVFRELPRAKGYIYILSLLGLLYHIPA